MSLGESQAARRSHRARVKRASRPDGLPIQTIPQENGSPESSPPDRPRRTHRPRSSRSWNCSKRYVIETRHSPPTSAQAGYPQENAQSSSPGLARSGIRSDNALLRSRVGRVAFRSTEAERCLQLWRGQPNRVRSERKQPCGFGSRVHAEAAFRLFCCAADTFAAPRSAAIERCPRVSSTPSEGTRPVGTGPAGSEKRENHLWNDCPQSFVARAHGRASRRRARSNWGQLLYIGGGGLSVGVGRAVAGDFGFEVAEAGPFRGCVQIHFGDRHSSPFVRVRNDGSRVIVHGR